MWWLSTCLIICGCATFVTTAATVADLKCNDPQCSDNGYDVHTTVHDFKVEGHSISIRYADGQPFNINCDGRQTLDSPALPSFVSAISVTIINVIACPLPTARSLADVLAALNVTLSTDGGTTLKLNDLPVEPQLTAHYFNGLENISNLWITTSSTQKPTPDFSFLTKLQNLRSLNMVGVPLPANVVLPSSVGSLKVISTAVSPLIDMLRIASNIQSLSLIYDNIVPISTVLEGSEAQVTNSSSLKEVLLVRWLEQRLQPLERCDSLQRLKITTPFVEELPNRWVAACPHLEIISIDFAKYLVSLPPKLLEGATSLKTLEITSSFLESIPDGFLEGAPNLINLELMRNNLKTLSSAAFVGPALQTLGLRGNKLENLEAIGSLTSLKELDIDINPLGNLCDKDGYSSLKNLVQLQKLNLRQTNITHLCRDWREDMKFLTDLYLEDTRITELGLADLLYTRDPSVKSVSLSLYKTPIAVHLTEDDYKQVIATPIETGVELGIVDNIECDCNMYWTWKALLYVNNSHWLNIRCSDMIPLKMKSLSEFCPERAGNGDY